MYPVKLLLKEFLESLMHPKETHMAETTPAVPTLTFVGGDYKPKRLASGLVGFRAPYDIVVEPGKTQVVELKTKCSHALLFPHPTKGSVLVEAQTDIVVTLTAESEPIRFAAGETISRAYPLFPVDYTIG